MTRIEPIIKTQSNVDLEEFTTALLDKYAQLQKEQEEDNRYFNEEILKKVSNEEQAHFYMSLDKELRQAQMNKIKMILINQWNIEAPKNNSSNCPACSYEYE